MSSDDSVRDPGLVDGFGRRISYVRMSVTDRCDLRCRDAKREILTLEELSQLADIFIARGVCKIRLTGGEPFVRRGLLDLLLAEKPRRHDFRIAAAAPPAVARHMSVIGG